MNHTEVTKLCMAISQASPAQKFDDDTPAFWQVILEGVRYEDAREAVVRLLRRQPFVAPADIIEMVGVIRADRLDRVALPAPNVDPDDARAYQAEMVAIREAIADGRFDADRYAAGGVTLTGVPARRSLTVADVPELTSGPADVVAALDGMFRRPPAPTREDYQEPVSRKARSTRDLTPEQVALEEAERARQLAAMEALMAAGTSDVESVPVPAELAREAS